MKNNSVRLGRERLGVKVGGLAPVCLEDLLAVNMSLLLFFSYCKRDCDFVVVVR